jgi:hypothetical protein
MIRPRQFITMMALSAMVVGGVAAVQAPQFKDRNLKVLPKDISDAKLDSIMHSYNKALGVTCNFCHVKPVMWMPGQDSLDYASDKEPMKETARNMMRMTIKINSENFWFNKADQPEYLHTVTCITCHQGEVFPPEH